MQIIKINDYYIKNLADNDEANVFAFVITQWHAYGVCAAIQFLSAHGFDVVPKIFICPSSEGKYLISDKSFPGLAKEKIAYCTIEKKSMSKRACQTAVSLVRLFAVRKKSRCSTIFMNTAFPDLSLLGLARNISSVGYCIIDEGVGSYYYSNPQGWAFLRSNKSLPPIIKRIDYLAFYSLGVIRTAVKNWAIGALRSEGNYINLNLLIENQGLKPNKMIIPFYRSVIDSSFDNCNQDCEIGNTIESIMINSQCFIEAGTISGCQDINTYKRAVRVFEKCGLGYVIKTHPRESGPSRYVEAGLNACEISLSQEKILGTYGDKVQAIISIYSSSLVTGSLLYGVKAISLARFFLEEQISEEMKSEIERFIDLFDGIVLFPRTENDLFQMLNS